MGDGSVDFDDFCVAVQAGAGGDLAEDVAGETLERLEASLEVRRRKEGRGKQGGGGEKEGGGGGWTHK